MSGRAPVQKRTVTPSSRNQQKRAGTSRIQKRQVRQDTVRPSIQPKLKLARSDSPFEREADRTADQVVAVGAAGNTPLHIQRLTGQPTAQMEAPVSVDHALAGPGRPLEPEIRRDMEQRFGYDFRQVRVHSDTAAGRSAQEMNAQAYTAGQDIVFGAGQFAPGTQEGRRLLAHELTHVVQQSENGALVQCDRRQSKVKPSIDVSRLTDTQKAQLRDEIKNWISQGTDAVLKELSAKPLTDTDRKTIADWRSRATKALESVNKRTPDVQRDVRRQLLEAVIAGFNDDLMTKYFLIAKTISWSAVAKISNPKDIADDKTLAAWRREAQLYRSGVRAIIAQDVSGVVYEELRIKPEDLQTEEQTAAEAQQAASGAGGSGGSAPVSDPSQDPSPKRRTLEDRQLLEDLYGALPDATDTQVGDEAKLLEELKKLSTAQLEQFKRYLQTTNRPGADPKPLSDAIAEFNKLSPVDREVMEVNKRLGEQEPGGDQKRLEGPVLLELENQAQQLTETSAQFEQHRAVMAQLQKVIQDPSQTGSGLPDLGIQLFVNEMAMALGLMSGGAYVSPPVKQVVQQLMAELATAREKILKDMATDAAITLALSVIPGAGAAKLVAFIKKWYDKFQALTKIYGTARKIEHIVGVVTGLGDTYQRFRDLYRKGIAAYEQAQALLADLDSAEDLEERIEAAQEQLMEQFEELLEGRFGDLLEMMYIPDDMPPEQLVDLVFNIPRGLEALERMWNYYSSDASKSEHSEAILMVRGFEAGKLLYPFVGLLAAEISGALSAFLNRRSGAHALADRLMPAGRRTGGKGRGRSIFRRRNRKRVKITDSVLLPYLNEGLTRLMALIGQEEPDQYWAPAWLRFALRKEVKQLNTEFAGKTVRGEVTQKSGKTRTTTTEQVPVPGFRLRIRRPLWRARKMKWTLMLNPKAEREADLLTNERFTKGVKYNGTPEKRQAAIRDWLGDAGYQLIHDKSKNLHIRLPGGERETKDRSCLRFAGGAIVKWKAKEALDDYKAFLGRTVSASADLPEGYHLISDAGKGQKLSDGDSFVQRKYGLADDLKRLGLDKKQQLVEGAGEKQPENLWPAKLKAPHMEGYSWSTTVDTMFAGPGEYKFNFDSGGRDRSRAEWIKHIADNKGLNRRPIRLEGSLGYTVRARLGSDRLGARYLPELKKRDDKGHLVARRFDGTDDYENLTPMKRSLNQAPGKWYELEHDMAQSYTGSKRQPNEYVSFKLEVQYPNSATRRPSRFVMAWTKRLAAKSQQPADTDKAIETRTKVFDNE